jgi:hypothetical protein
MLMSFLWLSCLQTLPVLKAVGIKPNLRLTGNIGSESGGRFALQFGDAAISIGAVRVAHEDIAGMTGSVRNR